MHDPDFLASLFEPVSALLYIPTCLASPFPNQSRPVRLFELLARVVFRFKKERNANHREAQRLVCAQRVVSHFFHGVLCCIVSRIQQSQHEIARLEVPFPYVAIRSPSSIRSYYIYHEKQRRHAHGVRNELYADVRKSSDS